VWFGGTGFLELLPVLEYEGTGDACEYIGFIVFVFISVTGEYAEG
jgi:hypothetical protein